MIMSIIFTYYQAQTISIIIIISYDYVNNIYLLLGTNHFNDNIISYDYVNNIYLLLGTNHFNNNIISYDYVNNIYLLLGTNHFNNYYYQL